MYRCNSVLSRLALWTGVLALFTCVGSASPSIEPQGPLRPDDWNDPVLRVPIEHWGCANCHQPGDAERDRIEPRPGPDLTHIGSRASAKWLRRWIAKPTDLRAAPTMPRLFGDSAAEREELEALVHFMASLGQPAAASAGGEVSVQEETLASGRTLYHQLGCVACHGALESPAKVFGDESLPSELPEVFVFSAFSDLSRKWIPSALTEFLRAPGEVHRDGRMPSMDLSPTEAEAIASYLLSHWGAAGELLEVDPTLAARGAEVYGERGCQACHTIEGREFEVFAAPSLAEISAPAAAKDKACLSGDEWAGARYDFPAPPLYGMFRAGLMAVSQAELSDPELDLLERRIQRLNCAACHTLSTSGGHGEEAGGGTPEGLRVFFTSLDPHPDLGDEGRFPPGLDGVGAKLTTAWFDEVMQSSGRARPYLATRMPQYGEIVQGLPQLFAKQAGVEPGNDERWPEASDERVQTGVELMGRKAMACVTCHTFGDAPPVGAPGTDMTAFTQRLRYAWWNEYIRDPAAFAPGTRMPGYMDGDASAFDAWYDGDYRQQTDAMWAYFSLGASMPPPEDL